MNAVASRSDINDRPDAPRVREPDDRPANGSFDVSAVDPAVLVSFGRDLDELKAQTERSLGPADLRYAHRLRTVSRGAEVLGRGLIHFGLGPVSFAAGVGLLAAHKLLEAIEIGHTVLHGAYDNLDPTGKFNSKTWRWKTPIDEESWRYAHNVRHHQYTNVAGRDPDIHFGKTRLTEHTPDAPIHRFQVPMTLLVNWPAFGFWMNMHVTGAIDYYVGNGRPEQFDLIKERSRAERRQIHRKLARKYVPYYAYEYGLFPLLGGVMWWRVMLANALAEAVKDLYSAATIYCGHVGTETCTYPEGTKAKGRGAWYAMQAAGSNDFRVPWVISVLCGGLDYQIEHHLFPKLPPHRLRQIAPQVEKICRKHGIPYRAASWPKTLKLAFTQLRRLSRPLQGRAQGAPA